MKNEKLIIVLPAFNEASVIDQVLENLKRELLLISNLQKEIVVVDDGSIDKTSQIAHKHGAMVLKHLINRGLGGALGTGLEYAKMSKADMMVTFDADGQHDAKDILKILNPILDNRADVVIGVRNIKKMPFDRRVITLFSSIVTFIFFGIFCQDTQSGFRAFNLKAINSLKIKTQRMEVSSEFFYGIKKYKLRLVEVPIRVIYTPYSLKKGQKNSNAVKILLKLILRLFR